MRVALIQMPVVHNKQANLDTAVQKIRNAAAQGIDFAVLPEMFCCPYGNEHFAAYGEPEGGPAQQTLSALAAELGIYIIDKSSFTDKHVLDVFLEILDGSYRYDPLPV